MSNRILEFYLTSNKKKIFKLRLFKYFGVNQIIFDKIHLKQSFIISLQEKAINDYDCLKDFFEMIIKLK